MNADKLLKTLPILQNQIDSLLEFQIVSSELNNGVINCSFILLFRDLIRLFACYNDGIINLLEKYFDMNKKQCREALDSYKSFLLRLDKVSDFLRVAESVGIDRGEIPDLTRAPASLLEALESHLYHLEGGKGPAPPTNQQIVNQQIHSQQQQPFNSANVAAHIDDTVKQKYLEEESQRLRQFEEQRRRQMEQSPSQGTQGASFNPFAQPAGPPQRNAGGEDLFGLFDASAAASHSTGAPVVDASNPFANLYPSVGSNQSNQVNYNATQGLNGNSNAFANVTSPYTPPVFTDFRQQTTRFDQQNQQQSASNGSSNGKFGRDVDTALTSLVDNLAIGPNSTASQSGSSVDWSGNKPFAQAAGNTYAQSSMTPQAPPNFGAMPQQQHQQQQQPWMQPMGGYGMPQQGMYNPYGMQPTPAMYGHPQAMPPMYGGGMGQQPQNPFPSNGMPGGPPPQQQYGQQFPPQQPQQQSKDPFAF
jgi:hypothetical protein